MVPKANIAEVLAQELRTPKARHYRVFMSSATDPYQPVEARVGLTRQCLEVLQTSPVAWLAVQTCSLLVRRDFDRLAQLPFVSLNGSIETDLLDVHPRFTRSSAHPERRLQLVREALSHGVTTPITVAPLFPYSPAFAEKLAEAVGEYGRAIVDPCMDGDGSGGMRSAKLGMCVRLWLIQDSLDGLSVAGSMPEL